MKKDFVRAEAKLGLFLAVSLLAGVGCVCTFSVGVVLCLVLVVRLSSGICGAGGCWLGSSCVFAVAERVLQRWAHWLLQWQVVGGCWNA
jgi:hypothetical protein